MRQKIYFDTDIVNNIADEHGEFRNKWPKVRALVEKAYSYRISFVTWKELVCRLARGDESYFKSHQAALRILHEPKPRIFMEYPPLFALRQVLGIVVPRDNRPRGGCLQWYKQCTTAILKAPSRMQADSALRKLEFDLAKFDEEESQPAHEQARLLIGRRAGQIDDIHPERWSANILKCFEQAPITANCQRLSHSLDTAFRYSESLCGLVKNPNYVPSSKKNVTAYWDMCQLFYLSDPEVKFVVRDRGYKTRVNGSHQAAQIVSWEDLVTEANDRK
jgi:hypothetical protein